MLSSPTNLVTHTSHCQRSCNRNDSCRKTLAPRKPPHCSALTLATATPNHLCHRAGSTSFQCVHARRRPQVDPLTSTISASASSQDLAGRAGIVGRQKHRAGAVVRRRHDARQPVYAPWPYRDQCGLIVPISSRPNRPQAHASTAMLGHTRRGLSWTLVSEFRIFVFSFSHERLIYSLLYISYN